MNGLVLFILAFMFFLGLWMMLGPIYDKAANIRAEKRAKKHFRETERLRRDIK